MGDPEGVRSASGRVIDGYLHVVDVEACAADRTGNPNARWWKKVDSSLVAVAARVQAAGVSGGVLVQAVGAHGFNNSLVIEAARALGGNWRAMVAVDGSVEDPVGLLDWAVAHGASGLRLFSDPGSMAAHRPCRRVGAAMPTSGGRPKPVLFPRWTADGDPCRRCCTRL